MVLKLRLKLLRLLIGKLSIIANISTDGNVLVGTGMVINTLFSDKPLSRTSGITYSSRINVLSSSGGIIDNNVIMGSRP